MQNRSISQGREGKAGWEERDAYREDAAQAVEHLALISTVQ